MENRRGESSPPTDLFACFILSSWDAHFRASSGRSLLPYIPQIESFSFTLKSFRIESVRARSLPHSRVKVVGFVRLRVRFHCFSFPSFVSFHGRPLAKESWRRGSISRPSEFILTNKPIKPPWLDIELYIVLFWRYD